MYVQNSDDRKEIGRKYYYGPSCAVSDPPYWQTANNDPYWINNVYSWRGRCDKSKARSFDRFYFEMDSQIRYDVCGINGNTIKRLHSLNMLHRWMRNAGSVSGDPIMELPTYPTALFKPRTEFCVHPRLESMKKQVIAELFAKANSPALFDGAPQLLELGESVAFVLKGLKALLKFWEVFGLLKGGIKSFESTWLAYRYGLMPLILSISDAIAAFEGGQAKGKVQHFMAEQDVRKGVQVRDFDRSWEWRLAHHSVYKLRVGAALDVVSQVDPHPLGLGLWDFIRGSWEIVPLSFVFDWFLDVGRWLTSLRNTNLVVGRSYCTTVLERNTNVWFDESSPHWTAAIAPSAKTPTMLKAHEIVRTIDIAPPSLPVFNGWKLNLIHSLDAAALIIGLIKGLLRR